jgi:hypothetical protein
MEEMGTYAKKPAGSGANFKKLVSDLKDRGVKDAKALAAWIGRKKYGKEKFQKMAAQGRKKKN